MIVTNAGRDTVDAAALGTFPTPSFSWAEVFCKTRTHRAAGSRRCIFSAVSKLTIHVVPDKRAQRARLRLTTHNPPMSVLRETADTILSTTEIGPLRKIFLATESFSGRQTSMA